MSDELLNESNYFGINRYGDLSPSSISSGGDFWQLSNLGSIFPSSSPTNHPFFELDENGNIVVSRSAHPSDAYTNLITPLYKTKPNFMLWLSMALFKIPFPKDMVDMFNTAFYLETAVGSQLDILGEIVGQSRYIDFVPSDGSSSTLSDENYRVLLKAKIANNMWDGRLLTLGNLWTTLFPTGKIMITDRQNMTMDVVIFGQMPIIIRDLVSHGYIVPKPQTVRINSITYIGDAPAFGFEMDTDLVSGFDKGKWQDDEPDPPYFGFDQNDAFVSGFDVGSWDLI